MRKEGMNVPAPPDQFQRKTYVRLPYADDYLRDETDRSTLLAIQKAFERPLLTVKIARPQAEPAPESMADRKSWMRSVRPE